MKKIVTLLLSALLICLVCAQAQADFIARVVNTENLNVRSGPGTSYTWLGSVKKDGLVRVVGESNGWYQVITQDGGISGYMSKNFLQAVENNAGQAGVYAVVTNTENLNLRSGPGSDYAWLGSAKKGDWIQIDGESGNWYRVTMVESGLTGYMSKNFLTVWQAQSVDYSQAVVQNPSGTRFLNLRVLPSYEAQVLDIFYNGEACTVISRQADGWWYVSAVKNGQKLYGYFRSEYLSAAGGGGAAGSARVNTSANGGNGGKLNLRDRPSAGASSQVIKQIPNGATVQVYLKGNAWWQVEYEGAVGFVDAGFLGGQGGGGGTPSAGGSAVVQTGNSGKLNLREQANANAKVLGKYANGTYVTVLQKGSAWCYVQVEGQSGYMMSKFLSVSGGASATKTVKNTNGGSYVNLRSSPEKTSGNVNVRVPDGASVSLLSWGQEWSQVSYNGKTGYMMSWFLK